MIQRFFATAGKWAPFVYAVGLVLAVILSVWYTGYAQRQSEQKWCEFVVVLDDAWSSTPPQSPLGRRVAVAMHELRTDFGCK
jgi:hypothetical protein